MICSPRVLVAAALALFIPLATAQVPKDNPVSDAARTIGFLGLKKGAAPASSPTRFKRARGRVYVATFGKSLGDDESERKTFEGVLEELIQRYEKAMEATPYANDASAALAYAISVQFAAAKGQDLPDEAFEPLVDRLRSHLDLPAVRGASDRKKQEAYEWALCSASFTLFLLTQASDDESKAKVANLASMHLQVLISAEPSAVTLQGTTVEVRAKPQEPVEKPTEKPASSGLAAGFTFQAPQGWTRDKDWYVHATTEDAQITAAHIRFPPAIPAAGNMGDAVMRVWREQVPAPLKNAAGQFVYRRYVGSKVFSQFVFGKGVEPGRRVDSLYTVMLLDCGATWQPVVIAQTFEDTGTIRVAEGHNAELSFPKTADIAEVFLATFRCSSAPNQAITAREHIAGQYTFGSGSSQDWVNVYTGASSTTFASSSGTLNLAKNGTFTYTLTTAGGQIGAAVYRGLKASGTYEIQGDILIATYTTYDQGDGYKRKEDRYRIVGLSRTPDGVQVLVMFTDLRLPVNGVSIRHGGTVYATKKP